MNLAWGIVLAGMVTAPLVTWFPMLAYRFPALGLPRYDPAGGADWWQMQTFWLIACAVIALIVGARDRWLGVMVALVGLTIFYRGAALDPTHSILFALGALLIAAVRLLTDRSRHLPRRLMVASGAFQVFYQILQDLGYDPLWGPLMGGTLNAHLQPLGTLAGVDASAAYIAIITPLMPLWLIPFAALVVWHSHSLGAVGAMLVGLAVMAWPRHMPEFCIGGAGEMGTVWSIAGCPTYRKPGNRVFESLIIGLGLIAVAGSAVYLHKETQANRIAVWQFATERWVQSADGPVLGWGLGAWGKRVPEMQVQEKFAVAGNEVWREAHNEPVQWMVETGLVGILILGLWLWDHRRMFAHPIWGGSLAALASSTLTWHPLHIVSSALVAIVLVGVATREEEASV